MNKIVSNTERLTRTSEKQVAANQTNALKSTGPTSEKGKALVALNGVSHGIYSISPVIEAVESKRSWNAYRHGMLDCLNPANMVEMTLAERIILAAWRLRRVIRYESEQIRLEQEAAIDEVGRALEFKLQSDVFPVNVQEILDKNEWYADRHTIVEVLHTAADESHVTHEVAEDLVWLVHEQLDQTEQFEGYWEQLPEPEAWTIGHIRTLVRILCQKHCRPFDELLRALVNRFTEDWTKSRAKAEKIRACLNQFRRQHLLPSAKTLEKVQKYESHLSRRFHRDLHELQRLQAMRLGCTAGVPIAIDVDVTTDVKSEAGEME